VSTFLSRFSVRKRSEVIIAKKLLTSSHPVSEEQEEHWSPLQLVEHSLGKTLVIHWWHTVAIVKHEFLLEEEDYHRQTGDREKNRDS